MFIPSLPIIAKKLETIQKFSTVEQINNMI